MKATKSDQTRTLKKSRTPTNKPKSSASTSPADAPTNEQIAALAYSIWEQEGRPEGRDLEHWRTAETQIRERRHG